MPSPLLYLAVSLTACSGQGVLNMLQEKESIVRSLQSQAEALWQSRPKSNAGVCRALDSCGTDLGSASVCNDQYGNNGDCGCSGRMTSDEPVIKVRNQLSQQAAAAANTACWLGGMQSTFEQYDSTCPDCKWMYVGTQEGAFFNYPGFKWGTDSAGQCGNDYDPRFRPWYLSTAAGPKNVVLILDSSGSMGQAGRLQMMQEAAKTVVDGLTQADHIGVVWFNDIAGTFNGLSNLAPALPSFRNQINTFIDSIPAGGGTEFILAWQKAFDMVDLSVGQNVGSTCNTAYVFLTDGEAPSPVNEILSRNPSIPEQYFVIGLGSDTQGQATLSSLACDIGGTFTLVSDYDSVGLREAMASYYRYYSLEMSIGQIDRPVWSERFVAIPNIWGLMVTVSLPVYDRDATPWLQLGVVSIEVPVCNMMEELDVVETAVPWPESTVLECKCLDEYSFAGQTWTRECTTDAWPKAWCAVPAGCGQCDGTVQPSGCWDECIPQGAEAQIDDLLRARSAQCPAIAGGVDPCGVEELRPNGAKCNVPGCESNQWEGASNIPNYYIGTTHSEWASNKGTEPVVPACSSCPDSMFPKCSVDLCTATLVNLAGGTGAATGGLTDDGDDGSAVIIAIIIVVVIVVLVGIVCAILCLIKKKNRTGGAANPAPGPHDVECRPAAPQGIGMAHGTAPPYNTPAAHAAPQLQELNARLDQMNQRLEQAAQQQPAAECPVCLMTNNTPHVITPCGHTVCGTCAVQFPRGARCPVCRTNVQSAVRQYQ